MNELEQVREEWTPAAALRHVYAEYHLDFPESVKLIINKALCNSHGKVLVDEERTHEAVIRLAELGECPGDLRPFTCPHADDEEQYPPDIDTECLQCWLAFLQRREGE